MTANEQEIPVFDIDMGSGDFLQRYAAGLALDDLQSPASIEWRHEQFLKLCEHVTAGYCQMSPEQVTKAELTPKLMQYLLSALANYAVRAKTAHTATDRRKRQREGFAARALEFAMLTAARSGEVRGANWEEIDFARAVWTIPGERMKAKREHRVPLSAPALDLLRNLQRMTGTDLLFPGQRGGPLSDMSLSAVMKRMEMEAVPHGLRSTFRDWAGERTNYPRDLCEQALAHVIESKAEAAYRRGDALEKRRGLMEAWAMFLQTAPTATGLVIPIGRKEA